MKIEKFFNKKAGREQFRARFQLNRREFTPTADSRKQLLAIVDEIRANEQRAKYDLPVAKHFPSVEELFTEHLRRLQLGGDRKKISIFERVSTAMIAALPVDIRINQVKKGHFQRYIDERLQQKNAQSGAPILAETINKELSAISVAFKNASRYYPDLEDEQPISIPKAAASKRRRERLVETDTELDVLLAHLRSDHPKKRVAESRRHFADELEMRYLTGFRRKEVVMLRKSQYFAAERALRDVRRWKTGTVTKYFPLTDRAVELVESRLKTPGEFLFSNDGKANESIYKVLRKACDELGIAYGTFTEGGWVPHDLRHNFSTEIVRVTDIETAKSLTGHSGPHILTYLHTDEKRQREAMNRREGKDLTATLTELYNQVKTGSINLSSFVEKTRSLIRNG